MAWKMVLPMEERIRFVLAVEQRDYSIAELCRQYGISRKTGYKWIRRYRAEGLEGMRERSRSPLSCPHKTSQQWVDRIIQHKLKHPRWGPKKIRIILQEQGWPGPIAKIGQVVDRQRAVGSVSASGSDGSMQDTARPQPQSGTRAMANAHGRSEGSSLMPLVVAGVI